MRFVCLISLLLLVQVAQAEGLVIRSSVPEEFPNGLYAKYMQYLANKMNMQLEIIPMPFARRIKSMRTGKIDILVGLQSYKEEPGEIIYLKPSYESLRHTFFVAQKDKHRLKHFDDIQEMVIGVTINATYFTRFNQLENLAMVPVSTLNQKIGLLNKGRIDTFIHFQESTLPTLKKMGLEDEIVIADFQTTERNEYYFTISKHSPLMPYLGQFEAVIAAAVAEGDFKRIRQQHYAD